MPRLLLETTKALLRALPIAHALTISTTRSIHHVILIMPRPSRIIVLMSIRTHAQFILLLSPTLLHSDVAFLASSPPIEPVPLIAVFDFIMHVFPDLNDSS